MRNALMSKIIRLIFISMLGIGLAQADGIYKQTVKMDYDTAYQRVHDNLENSRFYILDNINIGKNLQRFKDKWQDYNLNQLEQLQVMLICNGWYTNQVSNTDADMLALCPMRVTLIHKQGNTTVLFAKPSTFAKDSEALDILQEVETAVIEAINRALTTK